MDSGLRQTFGSHVGNTAQHCRLGQSQDSDFAGDLEDSISTSGGDLMYFWKPNICHPQLDVQETDISIPQFYRIWNYFVGCWIADGRTSCSWSLGNCDWSEITNPNSSRRETEILISCRMWNPSPPTQILLKASLSCTFFEDNKAVIKNDHQKSNHETHI